MSKRKTTIIIIITAVFLLIFSTIFAANITHFAPEYGITTANVNLRNMPTTDYSSFVRTLTPNTKIKIVGSIDNYYIVQLENNEVGIVSKDYAKVTGDKIDNLVYTDYSPFYASVKGNGTIVRGGPSTSFKVYGRLNENDKVYVIGEIGDFLLVITDKNLVGMIRNDLLEYYSEENTTNEEQTDTDNNTQNPDVSYNLPSDESKVSTQYILEKINAERVNNGLPRLELDSLLNATAQNKAIDMVKNNYFAHESPTYGSPFKMMQDAGITYVAAGENIAGNNNIDEAIDSFLKSENHRKNLLSNAYNYIGIGIEKSDTYGYIIVLMFIGK